MFFARDRIINDGRYYKHHDGTDALTDFHAQIASKEEDCRKSYAYQTAYHYDNKKQEDMQFLQISIRGEMTL